MTWAECAAAGMTVSEAARHRGMTTSAACMAARRLNLVFKREQSPCHKLTSAERADYDLLRIKGKFRQADALRSIGRDDLIP